MDLDKFDISTKRDNMLEDNKLLSQENRNLLTEMRDKVPAISNVLDFVDEMENTVQKATDSLVLDDLAREAEAEGITIEEKLRRDKDVSDLIDRLGVMHPRVAKKALSNELMRRKLAQRKIDGNSSRPKSKDVLKRRAKNKASAKQRRRK